MILNKPYIQTGNTSISQDCSDPGTNEMYIASGRLHVKKLHEGNEIGKKGTAGFLNFEPII